MSDDILMTDRFVFFWGGWPSQWYKSDFVIDGFTYNCCEQFMMAEKARVFGDADACREVLGTRNPREQKAIGRQVRGFEAGVWDSVSRGIVYRGNLAKYEQCAALREQLMATGERTIVEASPTDRIWGIGLAQTDPRALDPKEWQGTNWLGVAIMQVRDTLRRGSDLVASLDGDLRAQLERRTTYPG